MTARIAKKQGKSCLVVQLVEEIMVMAIVALKQACEPRC